MNRVQHWVRIIRVLLLLGGVGVVNAADSTGASAKWDQDVWRAELLAERADRDRQFAASPVSMLSAVAQVRHVNAAPLSFAVTASGVGRSDSARPEAGIVFRPADGQKTGQWEWEPVEISFTASYQGRAAVPGKLEPGMRIELLGRYVFLIFSAGENDLQFGIFDLRSKALQSFNGLVYYPPVAKYRLPAVLDRSAGSEIVGFATARSGVSEFTKIGVIEFELEGRLVQLSAFKERPEDNWLFVPFSDLTAGKETNAAGRLMTFPEPGSSDFVLDFNRAMNIPCAYSPHFDCPVWPAENRVNVAIKAGEKAYPLPE